MQDKEQKQLKKQMYIIQASCWKCKEAMNIAVIKGDSTINHGQVYGPELFSEEEIKMAENNNVIIKMQHSSIRRENYNANTCPHCDMFSGQHYLFICFSDAEYGHYQYKTIDIV